MPASEYSKDIDRTTDVQTHDQTPFSTIVSSHPEILNGLTDSAFINASPIQVAALPTIIAGNDTIVEAKNGTGKTLTFVIPTLMRLKIEQSNLQTIILAPTREIAVQIQQCIKKVGQHLSGLKCEYFIGGTSVLADKEKAKGCQIAVGSPGRIKHLLNEHVLKGSEIKSFILDEVDRLFTDKNFTKDIRLINDKLPKLKQMIVVSASIDKNDMSLFDEFMKEYTIVKGAEEDMNASQDPSKFLLGIKQYVACVKAVSTNIILLPAKNVRLLNILQKLPYTQCIIFTNYMTRVEAVCNMLRDHLYKADYIRGDQDQNIRLKLVERLKSFQSRILVATDLIARGIDSSNVDLVINMDCPNDWATYLHRIGRAGRFGNKGNAITILDDDKELESFKCIINSIENVKIKMLPIVIEKPILEYADNELENLDLTTVSDILTNNVMEENGANIIEENRKEDNHTISTELNLSNLMIESKKKNKVKSIYGPGISEKESLEKLCQVVKETEKELIDNNMINKKHLTADRSFVLFDPEPFLDDTEQYMKYNPQELIEIITKYDSNFEAYDAAKKSISENCIIQNDSEKELLNNNHKNIELEPGDSDSVSNPTINSKQDNEIKSIYGPGISKEESLQKLCQVVKETEKKLIDNNMINKKHLTADRSYVLFDPEPYLDDTEQYKKYSPQEIIEIITKYDSDFEMYEAAKNSISEYCILQKDCEKEIPNDDFSNQSNNTLQNDCEEKNSTNEVCSESNSLIDPNVTDDIKIDKKTCQKPRFSNIYDLFQIPDFSLLTPIHDNTKKHLADGENSDEQLTDKEESDEYSTDEDSDAHTICEEEVELEEDEYVELEGEEVEIEDEEFELEDEEVELEDEEIELEDEEIDVENEDIELGEEDKYFNVDVNIEDEIFNKDIEIKSFNENIEDGSNNFDKNINHKIYSVNSNNKPVHISICNNDTQENVTPHRIINEIENGEQLVDYDLLNDWYRQWRCQMSVLQTCVRMSK